LKDTQTIKFTIFSKKMLVSSLVLLLFSFCAKTSENSNQNNPIPSPTPIPAPTSNFAKGADISWITEMEAAGRKFYTTANVQTDCFELMKSLGMNTIRLRVWVNPTNGYNNTADVVAKATRAKNLGLRILINFHYSDTWADPGSQTVPNAWASLNFDNLKNALANHTTNVLMALKNANITPEWVQVGNETNDGMLWPIAKASTNMANYAQCINAGYDAVKAVFANAKVIVHVSNGWDNNLFKWNIGGLVANGAKFDVIGMSLYPSFVSGGWQSANDQCLANMNDMIARHNKEVMIVEVGMPWDSANDCKLFLTDIINKTKSIANNKGLGVLYWEPQSYAGWNGYTLGAFDNSGKPTVALSAFSQ
jgi:arabinogalactan endo-1,4-beta-galactosidase